MNVIRTSNSTQAHCEVCDEDVDAVVRFNEHWACKGCLCDAEIAIAKTEQTERAAILQEVRAIVERHRVEAQRKRAEWEREEAADTALEKLRDEIDQMIKAA